jgi:serine/threonine protein kinase
MIDTITLVLPNPGPSCVLNAGVEPIPGYRLLQRLGRGGCGEVWKCEAPGGLVKAIKFVAGSLKEVGAAGPAEVELEAIQRVKLLRHPFLLSLERVEVLDGELLIVSELADGSLADVGAEHRAAGRPGMPRNVLLNYLREAAEALDWMSSVHGLQHLDVKPQNLLLVSNHVKVSDFGLVTRLDVPAAGSPRAGVGTPVYAAPEIFRGTLSRHCDQYSLAIVYQELLTGSRPFTGRNVRQLLLQHLQAEPDLATLPAEDRPLVARALAKAPEERFASCSDFIRALRALAAPRPVVEAVVPRSGGACDTPRDPASPTDPYRPATPPPEVSEDYRLLDCVRATPLMEVWNVAFADGRRGRAKVVFGSSGREEELAARLHTLRHPVLTPPEVLAHAPDRLVLAESSVERTLRDVYEECRSRGLPGVPRAALLGHLRTVAAALDALRADHGLQHLGLHPCNLLLDGDRPLIADFGLVALLWLPGGRQVPPVGAHYAAPELFRGEVSPACDQYSLALIYCELLTGRAPETAPPSALPDLVGLPAADRAVIARALDPAPEARWDGCLALIGALEIAGRDPGTPKDRPPSVMHAACCVPDSAVPEAVRARFGEFCRRWKGKPVQGGDGRLAFRLRSPRSLWQRLTGRHPGLEVAVRLGPGPEPHTTLLTVTVEPLDAGSSCADDPLMVIGPLLLQSARAHLQLAQPGRAAERLPWQHPFSLRPVLGDGQLGDAVSCLGKDISLHGIGFSTATVLTAGEVRLTLPQTPETPALDVAARVVRVRPGDGGFDVGAVLLARENRTAHG